MINIRFAEKLRELRLESGLTRLDLSKILFVSVRTISYWELGQRECNLEQLASLAKIFDTTTDYLLGLED